MHNLAVVVDDSPAPASTATAPPVELARLVETYAGHLEEQASVLASLPGGLHAENHAEAAAYHAVVGDLFRLLTGELPLSSLEA
jgi:hypothetical protein